MRKTSKVTSKKQVTLPNSVMDALDLSPSDRVTFVVEGEEEVKIKKSPSFFDYRGSVKTNKPFDIKGMDKAVKEKIVENYRRKWNP